MPYKPEDKLEYEVEKIIAEIKVLKKPYLQLSFWVGLVALGLSIAGNVGQALTYESRAVIAKADVAQAKLDMIEMNNKRDLAKAEFEKLQVGLNEIKNSVTEAQQSAGSAQAQQTLKDVENKINNLEQTTQASAEKLDKSESPATTNFRGKLATAKEKEREGFQNLIDGDYDQAIKSFQESEDSFNSYHNAYDIAKLLRDNKSRLDDPAVKKEVFKTIVNKHAYGAPPDLFKEVKVIASR
jgi:hypothetical protein